MQMNSRMALCVIWSLSASILPTCRNEQRAKNEFQGRNIPVGGWVVTPGHYNIDPNATIRQCLSLAGGPAKKDIGGGVMMKANFVKLVSQREHSGSVVIIVRFDKWDAKLHEFTAFQDLKFIEADVGYH
jgi:protein involved in polysaccharide export with SLBB domain